MSESPPPIDWLDPKLTCANQITLPISDHQITAIDFKTSQSFVFQSNTKEVLRITPEGELIFADATEAAEALLREWNRITGRG